MYLLILILIIVVLYFLTKSEIEGYINYHKCDRYKSNVLMDNLFYENKFNKTEGNDWELYVPCGYTGLENELNELHVTNSNQKIFGITGCDLLAAKDNLWIFMNQKYGRKIVSRYLPDTYILNKNSDLELFKKNYDKHKLYLLKKNIQRKKGIKITRDLNYIMRARDDGYVVVQEYLDNLYLINKRKINLRVYLLITCKKGVTKWYLNKLGKCIYTNKDYNDNESGDIDLEKHLTSLNLDNSIYHKNPLTFEDLKIHLGAYNYDILFNRMIYILKMAKASFEGKICNVDRFKDNMMFQLFGLDFVFTNLFEPYLLEMNKGPQMKYMNNIEYKFKNKVIQDLFAKVGIVETSDNSFIEI